MLTAASKNFISVLSLLLAACFPTRINKYKNIYTSKDTTVSLSADPANKLEVLYTGCGGLVIHSDSLSVLIDPFYSNKGLSIVWKKLATDQEQVAQVCRRINDQCGGTGRIGAVLIAHSHYDHLMDLPYMLNTQLKNQHLDIIGSHSTHNALAHISQPAYNFITPQFSKGKNYVTLPLNGRMKLTVIQSEHAAHIKILGWKIKLMNGCISPEGVKGFNARQYKAPFYQWKEGEDYSFFIELKKENMAKPLRIFIQSSSCTPPAGIPSFIAPEDSVDLAFIGVASTNNVQGYPDSLLKVIKPRYVVLIHWEDFFRVYAKPPKIVRATNFKKFLSRYQKVIGPDYVKCTSMPRQLTKYTFLY